MSYFNWFLKYKQKHHAVIEKLKHQGLSKTHIVEYFSFDNMVKCEPEFCPLYAKNQKCHDVGYLNCYFCGCPHFRFDDNGITCKENLVVKSQCAINSKKALTFVYDGVEHLDCSSCTVPHTKAFVTKNFDYFTSPKQLN